MSEGAMKREGSDRETASGKRVYSHPLVSIFRMILRRSG